MPDINSFRVCSIALALCDCIESNLMVLRGRFIKNVQDCFDHVDLAPCYSKTTQASILVMTRKQRARQNICYFLESQNS